MKNWTSANKSSPQRAGSPTSLREGDWVCLKCNNLNFSFRKKCNRCKMQTKEQNDQQIPYYYSMGIDYCLSNMQESQLYPTGDYLPSSPHSSSNLSDSSEDFPELPKFRNLDSCSSEEDKNDLLSLTCGSENWDLFLNQSEDLDTSDFGEFFQGEEPLDHQIQMMMAKIII